MLRLRLVLPELLKHRAAVKHTYAPWRRTASDAYCFAIYASNGNLRLLGRLPRPLGLRFPPLTGKGAAGKGTASWPASLCGSGLIVLKTSGVPGPIPPNIIIIRKNSETRLQEAQRGPHVFFP